MNPRLHVLAGPRQNDIVPVISDSFSIGRDAHNDLVLPHNSVSHKHCLISREAGGFVVRDLGSSDGTLLNGQRTQCAPLIHGDRVAAGHCVLRFLTEPDHGLESDQQVVEPTTREIDSLGSTKSNHDLQALLRVSVMLHSFQKMYGERASLARSTLEAHLLELILDVIPAERGSILFYGEGSDHPSSESVHQPKATAHSPGTIDTKLITRVLIERCALLAPAEASVGAPSPEKWVILAPLTIRDRACGVVYLEGKTFNENHLQMLVPIAHIASLAIENASHLEWLQAENTRLVSELRSGHQMLGESPKLRALQRQLARAAQTASTVLILGESGTGKELVARAIHENSPRKAGAFVAVNCAALTETLLESELFGHEKGAFTGATGQKKGRLEMAEGGTMFLDEIGEMPALLQAKLLRVLQERQMERVGGTQTIKLDIRLIAATNRNLEDEVRSGRFRQDLYYRLNVVTLKTPALRERSSDIPLLAMHFAAKFARQCGRRMAGIAPEALAYLQHYEWPGNVRELENAMERAVVLGSHDMIEVEDLPDSIREAGKPPGVVRTSLLLDAVDDAKRRAVQRAFEQAKDDHATAAKILGVHPNYLYRLMRNLGMR